MGNRHNLPADVVVDPVHRVGIDEAIPNPEPSSDRFVHLTQNLKTKFSINSFSERFFFSTLHLKRLLDAVLAELLLGGERRLDHADVDLQDEVRVLVGQTDERAGLVPEDISGSNQIYVLNIV